MVKVTIGPGSIDHALAAVSRVSKLPTWTRVQAEVMDLRTSQGLLVLVLLWCVSGPYASEVWSLGHMARGGSWPTPCWDLVV